jgi:hypothetical protein
MRRLRIDAHERFAIGTLDDLHRVRGRAASTFAKSRVHKGDARRDELNLGLGSHADRTENDAVDRIHDDKHVCSRNKNTMRGDMPFSDLPVSASSAATHNRSLKTHIGRR